jgi:hypothetical protein
MEEEDFIAQVPQPRRLFLWSHGRTENRPPLFLADAP